MKSIIVSIVDVLGVFIPGFLFLCSIFLFNESLGSHSLLVKDLSNVLSNLSSGAAISLIVVFSYLFGYLIRLKSIRLLQNLTKSRWEEKMKVMSVSLNGMFESAVNNNDLTNSIRESNTKRESIGISQYVPYFHFAKRLALLYSPLACAEIERDEAKIRFTSGLLIPLPFLFINGILLCFKSDIFLGVLLIALSLGSLYVVISNFPKRRLREVENIYHLAVIILKFNHILSNGSNNKPWSVWFR